MLNSLEWDDQKKGQTLVIENGGTQVRQTQDKWVNVVGKTGYLRGKHSWILQFEEGSDWSIFVVCEVKVQTIENMYNLLHVTRVWPQKNTQTSKQIAVLVEVAVVCKCLVLLTLMTVSRARHMERQKQCQEV